MLARRFDAYFAPWANSKDVSGTLRVERAGVPVLVRHYGYADWNHRAPHTDLTRYSAASVTKGIVAATLVKLARDGTLSLDDPVAGWLPVLRYHPNMTLREVLHHRAGLPRDLPDDYDSRHEGLRGGWPAIRSNSGRRAPSITPMSDTPCWRRSWPGLPGSRSPAWPKRACWCRPEWATA